MKISINNEIVDATAEQEAEFLARQKEWLDNKVLIENLHK